MNDDLDEAAGFFMGVLLALATTAVLLIGALAVAGAFR